jgi:hypothetical protein
MVHQLQQLLNQRDPLVESALVKVGFIAKLIDEKKIVSFNVTLSAVARAQGFS